MIDDLLETLRAQLEALKNTQEHDWFAMRLSRHLDFVVQDPRTGAVVEDLVEEVTAHLSAFVEADSHTVDKLVGIKNDLIQLAPELDDSNAVRDPTFVRPDFAFETTLARFNEVAAAAPQLGDLVPGRSGPPKDESRTRKLLEIMGSKIETLDKKLGDPTGRPPDVRRRFLNIKASHERAWRLFTLRMRTSAGLSALELLEAKAALIPDAIEVPENASPDAERAAMFLRGSAFSNPLALSIFRPHSLDELERLGLPSTVESLKRDLQQLHEELVLRLRTTRSRRALIDRFKLRCESYDRDRLRALANAARGRPEAALVNELARYLFDAGLNPLIEPQIARLKPDTFEPIANGPFYLEAKQYKSNRDMRTAIRRGAIQVWDTANSLKARGLREVFVVIFRRGGRHCVLPDVVRADGLNVYPLVVNIAPLSDSGSQNESSPMEMTAEDLGPRRPGESDMPRLAKRRSSGRPSTAKRRGRTRKREQRS